MPKDKNSKSFSYQPKLESVHCSIVKPGEQRELETILEKDTTKWKASRQE